MVVERWGQRQLQFGGQEVRTAWSSMAAVGRQREAARLGVLLEVEDSQTSWVAGWGKRRIKDNSWLEVRESGWREMQRRENLGEELQRESGAC